MSLKKIVKDWQRRNYFHDLVETGYYYKNEKEAAKALRVVVLVRDDLLPPIHQGIQAAHAVSYLTAKMAPLGLGVANSYLILLGADANQMTTKVELAKRKTWAFAMYEDTGLIDPEFGDPVWTAVAFEPLKASDVKRYFGNLKRAE